MIGQSKLEKVAKKPGFEKVRQGINSLSDFVCIAIVTVEGAESGLLHPR
ncbi:MAG: hypothetical protein QQW96_04260 [Tychonema bourrellyi B0820]|nr:hypothetical protein [Tychonema bourrellyi]MDQ2096843.1 hypothetical protein [Tychonema bourrellyi B0820]